MWWVFDYLPECARRQAMLDLLTNSIELCFDAAAPGEHLGIGEEIWCAHLCSEHDDLDALCEKTLRWAHDVGDRYRTPHRLYWARRPTFHCCTVMGRRETCLICRFFVRQIPEDPHA